MILTQHQIQRESSALKLLLRGPQWPNKKPERKYKFPHTENVSRFRILTVFLRSRIRTGVSVYVCRSNIRTTLGLDNTLLFCCRMNFYFMFYLFSLNKQLYTIFLCSLTTVAPVGIGRKASSFGSEKLIRLAFWNQGRTLETNHLPNKIYYNIICIIYLI